MGLGKTLGGLAGGYFGYSKLGAKLGSHVDKFFKTSAFGQKASKFASKMGSKYKALNDASGGLLGKGISKVAKAGGSFIGSRIAGAKGAEIGNKIGKAVGKWAKGKGSLNDSLKSSYQGAGGKSSSKSKSKALPSETSKPSTSDMLSRL